jgi:hypothetical protein
MTDEKEVERLRRAAETLGVKVDRRWGADRLRQEIAALEPDMVEQPETSTVDEAQQPTADETPPAEGFPRRAGGHIDRGDGRGWEVEK